MNQLAPSFRIAPEDKLVLRGVEYRVRRQLPKGYIFARLDDPQIVEEVTHEQLHELSQQPDFRFERGAFDVTAVATRLASDVSFVSDLPLNEQEIVLWRRYFCAGFMKMETEGIASRSDNSMKRAIAKLQGELLGQEVALTQGPRGDGTSPAARAGFKMSVRKPPSPRTLRNWLAMFEQAGLRATGLRPAYRHCGDRHTERFPAEVRKMLRVAALLYASETRPSAVDVHKRLLADIEAVNRDRALAGMSSLPNPSYDRVLREIRSIPDFEVYAGRHGTAAAVRKFAIVASGAEIERPLQRVEIDEWRINLMTIVQDIGLFETLSPEQQDELRRRRFWACIAIDVATRVILGMRIAPSVSANLALETLEMVVTPKHSFAVGADAESAWYQHGTPEEVCHDQGATFMSSAFRRAIIDLGCNADAPPAGMPWLRGTIERFFRTIDQQALAPFSGRSFSNVVEKGDYDPAARASLTVEELCRILVRWVVDIYHNTGHAGLGGEAPANAWKRLAAKYGIIPPPDRHVRRAIFGIDLRRVMSSRGVRVLGLFFNSLELQQYRRKVGGVAIDIKLDPNDLGDISACVGDQGWIPVRCMRPGTNGIPSSIWQAATADLRRRFVAEAKLSDEVIAAAVRDAWDMARKAQQRTGILSTRPTTEELDRIERHLGIGFPAPDERLNSPSAPDLMAQAIPSGNRPIETSPIAPTKPSRVIKPRSQ